MDETVMTRALARLEAVNDLLTVQRVFGDPVQVDGVSVIPVAALRGGGGGGGGEGHAPDDPQTGSGGGIGFGVNARPVGVFVVRDGDAQWRPSVDVVRIVLGGQLVALAAIVVLGRVLRRRRRH